MGPLADATGECEPVCQLEHHRGGVLDALPAYCSPFIDIGTARHPPRCEFEE